MAIIGPGGGGGGVTVKEVEEISEKKIKSTAPESKVSGESFVSSAGKEAFSGLSWWEPKEKVAAAHAVLPAGAEAARNAAAGDISRSGIINVAFGIIEETTTSRSVALVKTEAASPIVKSASAEASDLGRLITNPGSKLGDGSIIIAVTPGVSWTMSRNTGFTGEMTVIISTYILSMAPTVILRGKGQWGGYKGNTSTESPCTIKNKGTGIGIYIQSGVGEHSLETNLTARIEGITLDGGKEGQRGIYCAAIAELNFIQVTCMHWQRWGAFIGQFSVVAGSMYACRFRENGENNLEELCGNCNLGSAPNTFNINACRYIGGIGVGCTAEGCTFIQCEFSNNEKQTEFVNSGNGLNSSESIGANGNNVVVGCWFQGSQKSGIGGSCIVQSCMFQGKGTPFTSEYAIEAGNGVTSLINCFFLNHGKGSCKEANAEGQIVWNGCICEDPLFIKRHTEPNIPSTWAHMNFSINTNEKKDFGGGSPWTAFEEVHLGAIPNVTYDKPEARMTPTGTIILRGAYVMEAGKEVKSTETLARLKEGMRPRKPKVLKATIGGAEGSIEITTEGKIILNTGLGAGATIFLDNLEFSI